MNAAPSFPTISIVTPSLNQARFLESTIRSVLDQRYPALEYVVIDGGSTDGSVDIIKAYSPALFYWESEPDRGHAHALNKGFSRTKGEIMAWLNSDDRYFPWTLAVVADIFSRFPDVEWIMGTNAWWDESDRVVSVSANQKNIYDFLMGRYQWIQQESVFWRRSLWERAGGFINERYRLMVDGELWCRFFLEARLWSVESILGGYRYYGTNRARTHQADCLDEMARAVGELETRCSREVRDAIRILRRATSLRRSRGPWPLLALRLLRSPLGRALERASYGVIEYDFGARAWKRKWTPFPL